MAMMKGQTAEKKSYPPIYEHSVQYAKEHGELKEFNESYSLNDRCRWAGEYPIPKDIGWKMHDGYLTVNTPTAALDGYVDLFRQEAMGQEKKSPDRTVLGKTAKVKPKAVEKVSVPAGLKENTPKPKQADDRAQDKDRGRQRGEAR